MHKQAQTFLETERIVRSVTFENTAVLSSENRNQHNHQKKQEIITFRTTNIYRL